MRAYILAGAAVAVLASSPAWARKNTVDVVPDNKSCFDVTYVPALYQVNTRGKLARKASVEKVYDLVDQVGGTAAIVRHPAIYIETRKLLEPDHYSMRPTACR
jgi:hypothetical protein